ncbi:hypothetical protein PLICRDRAFT_101083 [Plicaturopsis crispa FD-325 SS-3]|nr:hypothetical protein PLICRDRAFT_101083 [Plicaturopsis crispa FD-325 SS-3]
MSYKKSDDRKNVVIVGGGLGGTGLARELSAKLNPATHNLILINPRGYLIYYTATPRIIVDPSSHLEDTAFIPYDKLFVNGNGTLKQGTVTSIQQNKGSKGGRIALASGEEILYDVLALAPGSNWTGPLAFPVDPSEVTAFIETSRAQFKAAKHVVIAGGGAVGIGAQIAGEIKDIWPTKKVTIVQSGDMLLSKAFPERLRTAMGHNVAKRGIEIVYGDYIDEIPAPGAGTVKTRKGKTIESDLVVRISARRTLNTEFIQSLGPDVLTRDGYIRVRPTLQLVGADDIFAVGDAIDWEEKKQVVKVHGHVAVAVPNILSYVAGQPVAKQYKGSFELAIITNGKGGGVGYIGILWGIVIGDWATRLIKSKGLLLPLVRKGLGY